MSCPKTQHLLQEYFADDLAPLARDELDKHLQSCADCNGELEKLILAQQHLLNWEDQKVPHWDRGLDLFKREHRVGTPLQGFWQGWQWFPTAASLAMLCLMIFNVSFVSTGAGFSLSFGGSSADVQAQLASFEESQRDEMQQLATRMEQRQDNNNIQLMQAVLEQTQQSTAENFDQIYTYFEQQRLRDLQDMRVSYQQLVDSDYETIRSLEQLATFVSYQENVR